MSTKKFKVGTTNGSSVKAGKNNTKTVLTGLGIVTLGGTAAGLGYATGFHYGAKKPTEQQKEDNPVEKSETPQVESKDEQSAQGKTGQQTAQNDSQSSNVDSITKPQPVDTTDTGAGTAQTETPKVEKETIEEGKLDEESINDIANQIIDQQNIDPDDIDSPTIISVDELAIAYRPDGSEALVARIHTPDGGEFLLADYDGDGFFTDVFDTLGNYVGEAEGHLMASDLHHMVENGGGYLTKNDEPQGDDPTNDIINTDGSTSVTVGNDVAANTTTSEQEEEDATDEEILNDDFDGEISTEDIVAQLRDNKENDEEYYDDEEVDVEEDVNLDTNDEMGEG